jgi:hypothetical protein
VNDEAKNQNKQPNTPGEVSAETILPRAASVSSSDSPKSNSWLEWFTSPHGNTALGIAGVLVSSAPLLAR